ncbi:MAG: Crp/Fnr family transcriptional regulator [Flavobacteriaceae bacterium]|jgi:CRP-like cAMP-binding protein|nr:Crp/Fnr family transcriptional regulator [Flavobacteriaceae bacterium]
MDGLLKGMLTYYPLTDKTVEAFTSICEEMSYTKNDFLLRADEMCNYVFYLKKGLLGYYIDDEKGDSIYKMFFEEESVVTATVATILEKPSRFNIIALEDCEVIRYPVRVYRRMLEEFPDLAMYHIRYIEDNWIVAKEPLEISLKSETAKQRYLQLLQQPSLFNRLKQHHIASYLGVTPTQVSRIRRELNL